MGFKSRFNYFYKGRHRQKESVEEATVVIESVKTKKSDRELEEFIDTLQMLKLQAKEKPHVTDVYAIAGGHERTYNLTIVLHGTNPDEPDEEEVWAYLLDEEFNRVEGFCTPVISTKHGDGFLDSPYEKDGQLLDPGKEDWYVNWDLEDTIPIVIKAEELRRALLELGYSRERVSANSGSGDQGSD